MSRFFRALSQAWALSINPWKACGCQNFPWTSFEPELFTNKNLSSLLKINLVGPRAWGLFTASQKFGPGLWAQPRSTSISFIDKYQWRVILKSQCRDCSELGLSCWSWRRIVFEADPKFGQTQQLVLDSGLSGIVSILEKKPESAKAVEARFRKESNFLVCTWEILDKYE